MKKNLFTLIVLTVAAAVYAQEPVTVKVTGDHVSLRAAPEITAVLLDRAMNGDELVLKDNSNPDWIGVVPPETVDCWVSADYISDGVVQPALLNIRSGPSLSHSTMGVLSKGSPVTVRGQVEKWLRIAPPREATVWISRQYADVIEPPAPVVPEPVKPPAKTVQEIMADISQASDVLRPDPDKEQGVPETFSGILQPTQSILCKLVDIDVNEIVLCYVDGNPEQMKDCAQRPLKITGKVYWAEKMDMPIIVPSKIEILSE